MTGVLLPPPPPPQHTLPPELAVEGMVITRRNDRGSSCRQRQPVRTFVSEVLNTRCCCRPHYSQYTCCRYSETLRRVFHANCECVDEGMNQQVSIIQ